MFETGLRAIVTGIVVAIMMRTCIYSFVRHYGAALQWFGKVVWPKDSADGRRNEKDIGSGQGIFGTRLAVILSEWKQEEKLNFDL